MVSDEHTITRRADRWHYSLGRRGGLLPFGSLVKLDCAHDTPTSSFFYTFCGALPQVYTVVLVGDQVKRCFCCPSDILLLGQCQGFQRRQVHEPVTPHLEDPLL